MKTTWKKNCCGAALIVLGASVRAGDGARRTGGPVRSYLKYLLYQQVAAQAGIARRARPPTGGRAQIEKAASDWSAGQIEDRSQGAVRHVRGGRPRAVRAVRGGLHDGREGRRPGVARQAGEAFGLVPGPTDYASLRQGVDRRPALPGHGDGLEMAGRSPDLDRRPLKKPDTPDLRVWLTRVQPTTVAKRLAVQKTSAAREEEGDTLADAEPDMGEYDAPEEEDASPLGQRSTTCARNGAKKELEEAQAGMQQVAAERQAAEEEYAAKKTAAAQAEAERHEAAGRQARGRRERCAGTAQEQLRANGSSPSSAARSARRWARSPAASERARARKRPTRCSRTTSDRSRLTSADCSTQYRRIPGQS